MYIANYRGDIVKEVDSCIDDLDFLREASEDRRLYCQGCDEKVYLLQRNNKIFFAHYEKSKCDSINESADHKGAKNFLYQNLPDHNRLATWNDGSPAIRMEYSLGNTRPDDFLVLEEGQKVGIEYQRYALTAEDLRKKLYKNTQNGVATMYILGGKDLLQVVNDDDKTVRSIGRLERELNEIYGCLCYSKQHRRKRGSENGRPKRAFYRLSLRDSIENSWTTISDDSKDLVRVEPQVYTSLELVVKEHSGYLLAGFNKKLIRDIKSNKK